MTDTETDLDYAGLMLRDAWHNLRRQWKRCVFWRAEVRRLRRKLKREKKERDAE